MVIKFSSLIMDKGKGGFSYEYIQVPSPGMGKSIVGGSQSSVGPSIFKLDISSRIFHRYLKLSLQIFLEMGKNLEKGMATGDFSVFMIFSLVMKIMFLYKAAEISMENLLAL